jgi:hypothetical protein
MFFLLLLRQGKSNNRKKKILFILQSFMSVLIKTLHFFHLIFIYNYLLINDLFPF